MGLVVSMAFIMNREKERSVVDVELGHLNSSQHRTVRADVLAGECPSNLVRDALPSFSRGAHAPVLRVAVCGY